MVSNWPATAIDAPLVAAASAALISWARACDRAKLSSTLAAKRPSVASKASLRPDISPMRAWRLLRRRSRSGVDRLLLLCEIPSDNCERFRMLGELPGKSARVGLGCG